MDGQSDVFSELFVQCSETNKNARDVELEVLIDKLLKLDYGKRIFAITNRIAGEVLCHLALNTQLFSLKNEFVLNKYFQLVVQLTSSQEIILERSEANGLLLKIRNVWPYCMNNSTSLQALLDAVSAITYMNGPYISEENLSFMMESGESSLFGIAKSESVDRDIRRTAIQCLAEFCSVCDNGDHVGEELITTCLKFFVSQLQEISVNPPHDISKCRMVFALTKGLNNILNCESNSHLPNIGPLLAVLKKFMVYGLPGLSSSAPDELQPVAIPELRPANKPEDKSGEASAKPQTRKKKKKQKSKSKFKDSNSESSARKEGQGSSAMGELHQFRPSWARVTSSESEYSDTEGAQRAKLRSFLSKIRHMSLSTLFLTVKKTDKHTMLGYWSSFLPESSAMLDTASLFTSFREDTTPKCRAAAIGVVGALLEGSKFYLAIAAEETGSPSNRQATPSFVPFSVSLAASIREIHKQLLMASSKEQSTMALTQLLKTLAILVSNTPYRKMKPGLLVKVSSQARYLLLTTRDNYLKVAALAVLGAVVSTSAPLGEVASILTDSTSMSVPTPRPLSGSHTPVEHRSIPELSEAPSHGSWMIDLCISFSRLGRRSSAPSSTQFFEQDQPEAPHIIRVEVLGTLTKIVKGYLAVVKDYVNVIGDVICECLDDQTSSIRLNAGKLLEELGSSLLQIMKSSPSESIQLQTLELWNKVLAGPLQNAMQDHDSPQLQGKGCDCFSTMSPLIFSKLAKKIQIMCLTLLLGFTSDENAVVRSPAVRALGVFVMFPSLREDVAFLEDVAAVVVRLLDDSLLLVRANAAWSLGNLTDSIVINQEIRPHFKKEFQPSVLLQLFNRAMKSIDDKAKVVFNMMRVLGNLLRYADETHAADDKFRPLLLKATKILSDMVGGDTMVKVRWNACTACCNFLRNENLPLGSPEWTDHIYQSLCESVATCKNFKVRIKAALALSTPSKREHFGSKFCDVFNCVIHGFEDSNMAADFAEYKFRDTLQEQLCSTLIHISCMITSEDAPLLSAGLSGKSEEIKQHLTNYHNQINPVVPNLLVTNGHSSVTSDQSGVTDAIEEYIVVKQLTPEEKLEKLNLAIKHIRNLASAVTDNDLGDSLTKMKTPTKPEELSELFSMFEISD